MSQTRKKNKQEEMSLSKEAKIWLGVNAVCFLFILRYVTDFFSERSAAMYTYSRPHNVLNELETATCLTFFLCEMVTLPIYFGGKALYQCINPPPSRRDRLFDHSFNRSLEYQPQSSVEEKKKPANRLLG